MPQQSSESQHVAWKGDPDRDFLTYLLIRLARTALVQHFDEDGAEAEYVAWHKKAARRRRASDEPRELQRWDDGRGCAVTVFALPQRNRFTVRAGDDSFESEVTATYDPEIYQLEGAGVASFAGDPQQAAEAIETRLDFWAEDDEPDFNLDDLFRPDAEAGVDLDDDDAAEPGGLTSDDAQVVQRMARRMALRFADGKSSDLTEQDRAWLEATPQSLWVMMRGLLAAAGQQPPDDDHVSAWQFLLDTQVELIRFRSEADWPWAKEMLDDYQDRIIALARQGKTEGATLFRLVTALNRAKMPVRPDVGEAIVQNDPQALSLAGAPLAVQADMRETIDQLARLVGTPFETIDALEGLTSIAPPGIRAFLAHEFALSPEATLRDTVPLMLLDAESEVRRSAAGALEQIAAPDTLSPVSLRRIIALRNWIPEADRPAVDQVIRKARTNGIQIAQWDRPGDLARYASPIDGSGAQSLVIASRGGRIGTFCGILAKQEFGIRDSWANLGMARRDIASGLAEVRRSVASPEVEQAYFDVAVQHHIAVGVAEGHLATPTLLAVAEAIGATDWKDRRIDAAAETEQLFAELPEAERGAQAVAAALRRTGTWAQHDQMAESWYSDDAETRDAVGNFKARDTAGATRALLDGVLTTQRPVWAERCLLMARWARAAKPGQEAPPWRDFLLLAHELYGAARLADIPAMQHVAGRSVSVARGHRW